MRSAVKKEFAKFLFQRMSKERAVGLINSFPLLEMQKKILIEVDVLKIPQKQIAFDEGRDVKTISRRLMFQGFWSVPESRTGGVLYDYYGGYSGYEESVRSYFYK